MAKQLHRNALPEGFELQEYRLDAVIGHGGFGITYKAWDSHLEQWVAIKEYLPNELAVREGMSTVYAKSSMDEEAFNWGLQRFILEARTLAQFKHPNIVKVSRFFEQHHTAYMVMEYQEGESLSARLKRDTIEEQPLLEIVLPILDGLREVHSAGFLHRDIKPGNIFLRRDGSPVLLDFGAARHAVGQKSRSLTSIVSPGYAPFEQYDSKSVQGPWTDIYALGAVMYYAISGSAPQEVVGRLKRDTMPRALEVGEGRYRPELLKAVDWAMALDEEARPQSVDEWREALLAPPLEILPHSRSTKRPAASKTRASWLWGAVFVLSAIPLGYALYHQPEVNRLMRPVYEALLASKKPAGPPISETEVKHFIDNYFAAAARGDVEAMLAYYGDLVDYHDWGVVNQDAIRKDKEEFFFRWPVVDNQLLTVIDVLKTESEQEKIVRFISQFEAYFPDRENAIKHSQGKAKNTWRLRSDPDGLKIIVEKQTVLRRHKTNG